MIALRDHPKDEARAAAAEARKRSAQSRVEHHNDESAWQNSKVTHHDISRIVLPRMLTRRRPWLISRTAESGSIEHHNAAENASARARKESDRLHRA
jgi:hypothetical protein